MADRYRDAPLNVRLTQDDQEWLAKSARQQNVSVDDLAEQAVQHFRYWQGGGAETVKEALEIFEAEHADLEEERRRGQYAQRQYQAQSRRLHDMLRDERNRRWEQERQLRDERNRRIECEEHLRGGPGDNEGRARSAAAFRDAGYAPTVAKLLALAISSESDSEALAAFTKARSLHHQGSLSYPGLWHPAVQTAGTGIIFRTETSPGPAAESRAQAGLVCLRLGIEPAVALHNVPAT